MANIIDTLVMKLSLDNIDFKKGVEQTTSVFEKLKKGLNNTFEEMKADVKSSGAMYQDYSNELKNLFGSAITRGTFFGNILFSVFRKVTNSVRNFIPSCMNVVKGLQDIARETRQDVADIQTWQYAIEMSGGSASKFTETLVKLSDELLQAPLSHRSPFLMGLSQLGINVHNANGQIKDLSDLLLSLSDRMSQMSEARSLAIGKRLGLDKDTIRLLHQGREAVKGYLDESKRSGLITKENVKRFDELRKVVTKINLVWQNFKITIASMIVPILTKLGNLFLKLSDFVRENGDHIIKFIATLGALGAAYFAATRYMLLFDSALFVIRAGLALLTSPITLVSAALAALYLVFDDFITYLEGGDSVIGRVINKFKEWGKSIKENLKPVLEWLKDFWNDLGEYFNRKIGEIIELWDRLANKVRGIKNWFTGNDTASNVGAMQGNTSRVISDTINNSTSNYDFRGSSIITRATNGQDFQSLIGSEIKNSIGGIS